MTGAEVLKIVRDALEQQGGFSWLLLFFAFSLGALSVMWNSFLKGLFTKKGEHLATKEDFKELLRQVQETRTATLNIESQFAQRDWAEREWKTIRRITRAHTKLMPRGAAKSLTRSAVWQLNDRAKVLIVEVANIKIGN